MACTNIDIYANIEDCVGQKSLPGARAHAYYIKKSNIASWPTLGSPSATSASLESVATYTGDFTLAASKFWHKIQLRENVNGITSESQGEDGSKSFNDTATLIYPGTTAQAAGLAAMLNNDDVVFAIPMRDGKIRIMGNEAFKTIINPGVDTGKAVTDAAQTTLEIKVDTEVPAPFYPGKLMLDATTYIDGSDDTEKTLPG